MSEITLPLSTDDDPLGAVQVESEPTFGARMAALSGVASAASESASAWTLWTGHITCTSQNMDRPAFGG
jgi:hypothetical protein